MANFARMAGKAGIGKLDSSDLVALGKDLALLTGVKWLNGE